MYGPASYLGCIWSFSFQANCHLRVKFELVFLHLEDMGNKQYLVKKTWFLILGHQSLLCPGRILHLPVYLLLLLYAEKPNTKY